MSGYERVSVAQKEDDISSSNQLKKGPLQRTFHLSDIIQRVRMYPQSLTQTDVLQLQKTIGNGAVCQLMDEIRSMNSKPVQMKSENNTGLPDNLKAGVESLSGMDMSDVRVHYNSYKPAGLGALAYTQGTDIHVAPGQEKHLPHEAWHVVQQKQGRVHPTMQMKGIGVNDDVGLEREADLMRDKCEKGNSNAHSNQHLGELGSAKYSKFQTIQKVADTSGYQTAERVYQDAYTKAHAFAALIEAAKVNYKPTKLNEIEHNIESKSNKAGGVIAGEGYEVNHWRVINQSADQIVIAGPGGVKGIDIMQYTIPANGNSAFRANAKDGMEIKSAMTLEAADSCIQKAIYTSHGKPVIIYLTQALADEYKTRVSRGEYNYKAEEGGMNITLQNGPGSADSQKVYVYLKNTFALYHTYHL